MDSTVRKPFQGVTNIILFNWHTFVIALVFLLLLIIGKIYFPDNIIITGTILATLLSIVLSLITSLYVYDLTDLYKLRFLDKLITFKPESIVNINAGFDEISEVLKRKFQMQDFLFSIFMIHYYIQKSLLKGQENFISLILVLRLLILRLSR